MTLMVQLKSIEKSGFNLPTTLEAAQITIASAATETGGDGADRQGVLEVADASAIQFEDAHRVVGELPDAIHERPVLGRKLRRCGADEINRLVGVHRQEGHDAECVPPLPPLLGGRQAGEVNATDEEGATQEAQEREE
eukprot:CAMPEP_0203895956 /NCGR_PEP_ID=MMETSP0359-20131031/38740_1 /ASSEMBLY_ACC=CAM_ASM_000338 /TAXON_ID=268821 /ORGANISM="Scrippsiella Hangoei, Strain SHTV-5" /LENGTH=137 /DNA_ID=CAMNT_0050818527 /DNA_START=27 /DNA_END=436 /DNA_ORIENTATION=+